MRRKILTNMNPASRKAKKKKEGKAECVVSGFLLVLSVGVRSCTRLHAFRRYDTAALSHRH